MKRETDRKKAGTAIIYGLVAAFLFALVWFATFRERGQAEDKQKVWALVMGDSIL